MVKKKLLEIAARLGVTLLDLATSKKALAVVAGWIAHMLVKDPASRSGLEQLIMAYLVGQGIADHGKAVAEGKLGIENAKPLPIGVIDSPGASVNVLDARPAAAPPKP